MGSPIELAMAKRDELARRPRRRRYRWILCALAILIAVLVVVGAVVMWSAPRWLIPLAIEELEQNFPFEAQIETARLAWPGSATLEGVVLVRPEDDSRVATVRRITASTDLGSLLRARVRLRSIVIDGVELSLRENDLELIEDEPPERPPQYTVMVRNLRADIFQGGGETGEPWLRFEDVEIDLVPKDVARTAVTASGYSHALRPFRAWGVIGGAGLASHLTVSFPRIELGPRVRDALPDELKDVWDRASPSGTASLTVEMDMAGQGGGRAVQPDLSWRLTLADGTAAPDELPYPVEEINATLEGDLQRARITRATGIYRSALISGSGHTLRYEGRPAIRISCQARRMQPWPEMYDFLQPNIEDAIRRVGLIDGQLDADLEVGLFIGGDEPNVRDPIVPYFLRASVHLRDGVFEPEELPYRLTRAGGAFVVDTETLAVTSPIIGRLEKGAIRVSGRIGLTDAQDGTALKIHITELPVDDNFEKAVKAISPGGYNELQRYDIRGGKVDADLEVKGHIGVIHEIDWTVTAVLDGADVTAELFPLRLSDVSGRFRVRPDRVTWDRVVGRHGTGRVAVAGEANLLEPGRIDLYAEIRDLPINPALERALESFNEQAYRYYRQYGVEGGTVNADVSYRGEGLEPDDQDWFAAVTLIDSTATPTDFPYKVTDMNGLLHIRPDRVDIVRTTGRHEDALVSADGWVRIDEPDMRVDIRADNIRFDKESFLVAPSIRELDLHRLEPKGRADLHIRVSGPNRPDAPPDIQVAAQLKDSSARFPLGEKWLSATNISGLATYEGNTVRLRGIRAKSLGGMVTSMDGLLIFTDEMSWLSGEAAGDNFQLAKIVEILPEATGDAVRALSPDGTFTVRRCEFNLIQRPGETPDVEYAGTVEFRDVKGSIPLFDDDAEGEFPIRQLAVSQLSGRATVDRPRGRVFQGALVLDKVNGPFGMIQDLTADVERAGPLYSFRNVRGNMHGGLLEGELNVTGDLSSVHGHIAISEMDVSRINDVIRATRERVWGKMRGSVQFSGRRRLEGAGQGRLPNWTLSGSGSMDIDRGNLGQTMLVRSIYDVSGMFAERPDAVEGASLDILIDNDQFEVESLVIRGARLSTRGVGVIHYLEEDQLDLIFYRQAHGSLLPNIPIIYTIGRLLNQTLDVIRNELLLIRVTGNATEPSVSPILLRNVERHLQPAILADVILGGREPWREVPDNEDP